MISRYPLFSSYTSIVDDRPSQNTYNVWRTYYNCFHVDIEMPILSYLITDHVRVTAIYRRLTAYFDLKRKDAYNFSSFLFTLPIASLYTYVLGKNWPRRYTIDEFENVVETFFFYNNNIVILIRKRHR